MNTQRGYLYQGYAYVNVGEKPMASKDNDNYWNDLEVWQSSLTTAEKHLAVGWAHTQEGVVEYVLDEDYTKGTGSQVFAIPAVQPGEGKRQ